MAFRIETIAIGDELLTGTIADTNTAFIGSELMLLGHRLDRETAIEDDGKIIQGVITERVAEARVIFLFGGLGPTSDDRTVDAVCELIGCGAIMHERSRLAIEASYRARNQPINVHALKQALYPDKARPLDNSVGMAPGFHVKISECDLFFLPGVPLEMKAIFGEQVRPILSGLPGFKDAAKLRTRLWKCIRIFESQLQVVMDPIEAILGKDAVLGYRTHFPENHLTLYFRGTNDTQFEKLSQAIENLLAPWCFTRNFDSMEEVVFKLLRERKMRLSVAESCTAGLVANRLSRIPGASEVLWGGVCVYQLDAKAKLTGVVVQTPDQAVSLECSRELAKKMKAISGTEMAAAITGYLGSSDCGPLKPAGTIFCCVIDAKGNLHERELHVNVKDRERAQWGAATHLLDLIRNSI